MGAVDRALGYVGAGLEFIDEHPFIGTTGGVVVGFLLGALIF